MHSSTQQKRWFDKRTLGEPKAARRATRKKNLPRIASALPEHWIPLAKLAVMFNYTPHGLQQAIHRGSFQVPTFMFNRCHYCDKEVLRTYILNIRRTGLQEVADMFEDLED